MVRKLHTGASGDNGDLRQRAEAQAVSAPASSDKETQELLHELQVHQIELGLQNAELREARAETEASLERYTHLYDFAPVGYFTLERDGVIAQTNLAGAHLLGLDRSQLVGRRFGVFIADDSRPLFSEFLEKVFTSGQTESCESKLQIAEQRARFVLITGDMDQSG